MRNIGAAALMTALAMAGASGVGLGASVAYGPRLGSMGGHQPKYRGPKTKTARERVPKMLRQYAKRYGKHAPDGVLQIHEQLRKVPMLDHWRDRREAMQRAMGVAR